MLAICTVPFRGLREPLQRHVVVPRVRRGAEADPGDQLQVSGRPPGIDAAVGVLDDPAGAFGPAVRGLEGAVLAPVAAADVLDRALRLLHGTEHYRLGLHAVRDADFIAHAAPSASER